MKAAGLHAVGPAERTIGSRAGRCASERAVGLHASIAGLLAFLVFLLFAVQVLFGLYARTTVGAITTDIAHRAARSDRAEATATWEAETRSRLGDYANESTVTVSLLDGDGDGTADTVVVRVDADLPQILPLGWTGLDPATFTQSSSARIQAFQETP